MRLRALAAAMAAGTLLLAVPLAWGETGLEADADDTEAGSAEPRPLWEAGIAAGAVSLRTYAGSSTRRFYAAGSPYFVYRGPHLRASGRSVRVVLFERPRLWADLSGGGWLPISARDDPARDGMPRVDFTVQAGPRINYRLPGTGPGDVVARLAVRAVWSARTFMDVSQRGYVVEPVLDTSLGITRRLRVGFRFSGLLGNGEHNGYFYDVPSAFATPERPAYDTGPGLVWLGARPSMSYRVSPVLRLGAFVDLKTLAGSVAEDSPLVRERHAVSAGVGLVWVFYRSRESVTGRPADPR